jgi:hypothetical protein
MIWLAAAECVLDPLEGERAVGLALNGDDVEAHQAPVPVRLTGIVKLRGPNELALFTPGDRGRGSAEVAAAAVAHFDEYQDVVVEADQVDFAGLAAKIAGADFETLAL